MNEEQEHRVSPVIKAIADLINYILDSTGVSPKNRTSEGVAQLYDAILRTDLSIPINVLVGGEESAES
jgi:hypothetical protein